MKKPAQSKTWHEKHAERLSRSQRIADAVAGAMGSWNFIIWQTILVSLLIILNIFAYAERWDPYPFILLNLIFSTQAAYTAPIIMMSQNRQNERDRAHADADFETNVAAKKEIEELQRSLARIENDKLDKIISLLQKERESR